MKIYTDGSETQRMGSLKPWNAKAIICTWIYWDE